MYGAILGDIIGAPYEFDMGDKTKIFPLFGRNSRFTDDTVMTVAVAEALMETLGESDDEIRAALVASMRKWGNEYPNAGYGQRFYSWLWSDDPQPYGSYGNGSAMRVSSAGWLFDTLEQTRHMARLTAEVTHNHPEGIKGAEATASAIFLARTGATKDAIKDYIVSEFRYDLTRTCDEIRPTYRHVETCQHTVPEAITAFLEGKDFEDVIRTAVSLGGDCDTLTCIAGSIAEAFYVVPEELKAECRKRLPEEMQAVLDRFDDIMTNQWSKEEIISFAKDLIDELRECDDGAVTSTAKLLANWGYDTCDYTVLSLPVLFEIHNTMLCLAKENHISLTSPYDEMPVGLPFYQDFVVKNEKARIKCPFCGSTDTARILYGLPAFNDAMEKKLNEGKLILGGCCIQTVNVNDTNVQVDPARKCNKCRKKFGTPPVLISKDRKSGEWYRDIITSVTFEVGGYFGGYTKTLVSKIYNGALVLVTKPYEDESTATTLKITPKRWNKLIDKLYEHMFVHEWKKKYVDPGVLDGTQWSLDVEMTDGRKCSYHGSNEFPPYWEELVKAFKEVSYKKGGKSAAGNSNSAETKTCNGSSGFPGSIVTMEDTLEEYEALYGDIFQLPDPEKAIRKLMAEGFFARYPEMISKLLQKDPKTMKKT